jgi:hypothetical protein
MEERITIRKASYIKPLILAGFASCGFELLKETKTTYPISMFFNRKSGMIAIYDRGPHHDDEIVILDIEKPAKAEILIREYRNKKFASSEKRRFLEIADALETLIAEWHQSGQPVEARVIQIA